MSTPKPTKNPTKTPKTAKTASETPSENAVLYISHLPYGFDDRASYSFFSQFGTLKGICFPRSKKSGRSKGYMFLLFESRQVAEICAQAVNGYFLFKKSVKCLVLPKNHKIIYNRFKKNPKKFRFVPWAVVWRKSFGEGKGERKVRRIVERDEEKKKRVLERGWDFEYVSYGGLGRGLVFFF